MPLKRENKHEFQAGKEVLHGFQPMRRHPGSGDFDPASNKIKLMTMKVSKGLEFPLVVLPGLWHMTAAGEEENESARIGW
eukprot:gene24947-31348_t